MIYAAYAIAVACGIALAEGGRLVRALIREQARERQLLINQILHLSGRTWTPPPAAEPVALEQELDRYVNSPSDLLEDF